MSSKRLYLTHDELEEYTDITVTDTTEADDQITQAEELIDAYVGPQDRAVSGEYLGRMSAVSGSTFTLETDQQNMFYDDYFKYCVVEIVGGTGIGQIKKITSSTYAGVLTTEGWDTTPDTTSVYKIYQLGKFPRKEEEYFDSENTPNKFYRHIVDAVRRATAAQVQYMIEMGANFFASDNTNVESESIGDYSYTKKAGGVSALLAPKAKSYLRGIINRRGVII